jgi:hypothetical protein
MSVITNLPINFNVLLKQEVKPAVKEESSPATKGTATPKVTPPSSKTGSTSGSTGPVTEEEIRAVLLQNGPVTTQDLVARFKSRLRTPEVCSSLALCKLALYCLPLKTDLFAVLLQDFLWKLCFQLVPCIFIYLFFLKPV